MISYFDVAVKLSLGILCLIFQINLMGKGNLAPTSAMDQVQNYVLGGIIGGVIYNDTITVLQFFLVLLIWTLLISIIKFLKDHNYLAKRILDGQPVTVIANGEILVENCMRRGISANDLSFKLRASGIYEIKTVRKAIQEQNGQFTIVLYGEDNIKYPIIVDGQANHDVLDLIDHDEQWLSDEIGKKGYPIRDIYLAEYQKGDFNIYPYAENQR